MLLSIIIPTKNRQYTALYAIASALELPGDDFEIIVQDCSDEPSLETDIRRKFGMDQRIKYMYSDTNPSMTDNWSMAFEAASGDYVCGIGDDDAVLPEIVAIAAWAKANDRDALTHSANYTYAWPGFYNQPFDGTLVIWRPFTGNISTVKDYYQRVRDYGALHNPMGYFELPSIYHSLISRRLIDRLKNDTGKLLDSGALDIYTAISFSKYLTEYTRVDFPFTFKGASPKSNSERLFTGKTKEHFEEFKGFKLPDILPASMTLSTIAAEAYITACRNTKREDLIDLIDLPVFYADVVLADPHAYQECKKKLDQYVKEKNSKRMFYNHLRREKYSRASARLKKKCIGMLKSLPMFESIYRKIFPLIGTQKNLQATTVLDVLAIHKQYISENSIQLHFLKNKK